MDERSRAGLEAECSQLVGKTCWEASLVNGEELQLEIGERIPIESPRLPKIEVGAWTIIVSEAQWRLEQEGEPRSRPGTTLLDEQLRSMRDVIKAVVIDPHFSLTVSFVGGPRLRVQPNPVAENSPYWELFTPRGTFFRVAREGVTEARSDVPE